jgi:hypothetical protein
MRTFLGTICRYGGPLGLFTRRREDYFKTLLDLLPTIQSVEIRRFRNVRIENGHVIGERASERVPVEVIERNDKLVESPLDIFSVKSSCPVTVELLGCNDDALLVLVSWPYSIRRAGVKPPKATAAARDSAVRKGRDHLEDSVPR